MNCQARKIDVRAVLTDGQVIPYYECTLPAYHEGEHDYSTELTNPDNVQVFANP